MRARRVLVNAVSAKMGGAANYIESLTGALAKVGTRHEWTFLVPPSLGAVVCSNLPGATVMTTSAAVGLDVGRIVFDLWSLRRLCHSGGFDTLYSTGNVALFGSPCRQLLLMRNALFFSKLYREEIQGTKSWRARAGEAVRLTAAMVSARVADVVITPSQTMHDEVLKAVPEAREKTVVIPYGVDLARFRRVSEGRSRRDLTRAHIFFPSLYSEHKNVGTLLQAIELLDKRGVGLLLETSADPRPEAARSQQAAREARLADALSARGLVRFVGEVARTGMADRYAEADLVVYPSVVESFGHPLVESMAASVPIVAADVPINREICENAAEYFEPFDPRGCAAAIERVLVDGELRSRLASRSAERAASFSWEAHVKRLEELIGSDTPSM